ncbi:hypothetical protein [Neomesorhizobium albiziae]|uniref:hypothetical protein n=1 Tax=Neomesorhizobium albiziae TaxID=335020 RepID=UPI00122D006A|nr:hypothetical protein [Mesorhizobium albiziae]GLS31639.1 hypothetical protein GCM10007937_33490 [Mesorhizobium albiziae]
MSQLLVRQYLDQSGKSGRFPGSATEGVTSEILKSFREAWPWQVLAAQHKFPSAGKMRLRGEGMILHSSLAPSGARRTKDRADDPVFGIVVKPANDHSQGIHILEAAKTRLGGVPNEYSARRRINQRLSKKFDSGKLADYNKHVGRVKAAAR